VERELDRGVAVRRLLDDPEEAGRIGRAAQQHVREQFVGDLHLLRYAALFSALTTADGDCPA
jgi:hypothetical protein